MSDLPATNSNSNGIPPVRATSQPTPVPARVAAIPTPTPAARFLLIRSGMTDYDSQGRIKGRLDIPLSAEGLRQIEQIANDTKDYDLQAVYSAPCRASMESARALARGKKVKSIAQLENLDHGLWEGKLIDEVKSQQPKVFKRWQEQPDTVCPPGGEMLESARSRLRDVVAKVTKKYKTGVVAMVLPEPLATVLSCDLQNKGLGDLWQSDQNAGQWELIEYFPPVDD